MAIVISVEVILGCSIYMIRMISCNLRAFCFSRRKIRVFGQWVLCVPTRHFHLSVCLVSHRLHDAVKLEKEIDRKGKWKEKKKGNWVIGGKKWENKKYGMAVDLLSLVYISFEQSGNGKLEEGIWEAFGFEVFLTVHHRIDFSKYQLSAQFF